MTSDTSSNNYSGIEEEKKKNNIHTTKSNVIVTNVSEQLRTVVSRRGDRRIQVVTSANQQIALEELGYKQELLRKYTWYEMFGVCFSIMGLMPSIGSTSYQAFSSGASSATWGWLAGSCGILTMGIALAEIGSSFPTASAIYLATWNWSPPKYRNLISYAVGFTDTVSLSASVCSITSGCASQIYSCVQLYNPDFVVTNGNTYGLFAGLIIFVGIFGCMSTSINAKIQNLSSITNIFLLLLVFIALPIATHKNGVPFNDAKFIFTNVERADTNWPSGWYWLINSFQPAVWTIGAFDAAIHMQEEAIPKERIEGRPILLDPAASPASFGIVSSITACGILGWLMMILLCACMGPSILDVINTDYDQSITQIFMYSMGKKWTVALMSLMAWSSLLMAQSCLLSTSRQFWAMARDYGIPTKTGSEFFAKVWKNQPINAMIGSATLSLLLGLMMFGGDACSAALFSLSICGMYMAIIVPIILRLTYARKDFNPGTFYLGKFWSPFISWCAVIFMSWMIFIVCVPLTYGDQLDQTSMNYTVVIGPGFTLLAMIHYQLYQYKFYRGPHSNLSDEEFLELMGEEGIDQIVSNHEEYEKKK
ncbi:amino acid transporter [Hanseniaspora valbyensis NRRL Y-1626]|uniref:Amino acid transporter n=1 Tax=Hanseniaspora valbyensis NRRL Y-1626 TaxID=766949 RepID=A0A1B7T8N3_9ASCO|nr:amino acid transporter [Hanseniaspora valbyensis NRRL Y-1626]